MLVRYSIAGNICKELNFASWRISQNRKFKFIPVWYHDTTCRISCQNGALHGPEKEPKDIHNSLKRRCNKVSKTIKGVRVLVKQSLGVAIDNTQEIANIKLVKIKTTTNFSIFAHFNARKHFLLYGSLYKTHAPPNNLRPARQAACRKKI